MHKNKPWSRELLPTVNGDPDREVERIALKEQLNGGLPYAHTSYFDITNAEDVIEVPLNSLIWDHFRLQSVEEALLRMVMAQAGSYARRGPISVRREGQDRFYIVDGNSTAAVAWASNWPDIPARLIEA